MNPIALPPSPLDGAAGPSLDGMLPLPQWGLIRAQGTEARSFLHGQLTQDMLGLTADRARLAGYCSAKGRLLASFVVWSPDSDTVFLACSADLLPPTLKRLTMFVLRAKCRLADVSAERPLWGLAGASAAQHLGASLDAPPWSLQPVAEGTLIRLPDALLASGQTWPRWLFAAGSNTPVPARLAARAALSPALWQYLEATSGVVRITAATSEQFVPQMVNLELVGGVDFQKGCYPGQEVVARSQYRGSLKRRAQLLTGTVPLQPGQEVFHSADPGQPAGRVALAGQGPEGRHVALVELKLAALAGGSLHLGTAEGPMLAPSALPYALPTEVP